MPIDRSQILGAVDNYGTSRVRAAQLQQLAREGRMSDLQYQQAQQGVTDDQAQRQAFSAGMNPDGTMDRAKVLQALAQSGQGQRAQALAGGWAKQDEEMKEAQAKANEAVARMTTAQREAAKQQNQIIGKTSKWILGLPPEQQQQGFDLAIDGLGLEQFKGQKVNPQQLQLFASQAEIWDKALTDAKPLSSIGRANYDVEKGFMTPEQRAAYVRKETYIAPSSTGMVGGGMTSDAVDMMADQFRKTGVLPSAGMGAAGTALRIKIANRAAEMDKEEGTTTDLAEAKQTFKTAQQARAYFTSGKGADAFRQQETILHHADAFTKIADALNNGDIQVANRIGNTLGVQFGSDKATNYKIVGQVLSAEVGKYLAGSQSTEVERRELSELIPVFSSPEQIKGGLATLKTLVEGQRQSWTAQRDAALKGQVPTYAGERQAPTIGPAPASVLSGAPPAIVNAYYAGKTIKGPDGKSYRKGQ